MAAEVQWPKKPTEAKYDVESYSTVHRESRLRVECESGMRERVDTASETLCLMAERRPYSDPSTKRRGPSVQQPQVEAMAGFSRRTLLKGLAALGVGTATFRRALAAQAAQAGSGHARDDQAGRVDRRARSHRRGTRQRQRGRSARSLRSFAELRKVDVGYDVPPALTFLPAPPRPAGRCPAQPGAAGRDVTARRPARPRSWRFCRSPSSRP